MIKVGDKVRTLEAPDGLEPGDILFVPIGTQGEVRSVRGQEWVFVDFGNNSLGLPLAFGSKQLEVEA